MAFRLSLRTRPHGPLRGGAVLLVQAQRLALRAAHTHRSRRNLTLGRPQAFDLYILAGRRWPEAALGDVGLSVQPAHHLTRNARTIDQVECGFDLAIRRGQIDRTHKDQHLEHGLRSPVKLRPFRGAFRSPFRRAIRCGFVGLIISQALIDAAQPWRTDCRRHTHRRSKIGAKSRRTRRFDGAAMSSTPANYAEMARLWPSSALTSEARALDMPMTRWISLTSAACSMGLDA